MKTTFLTLMMALFFAVPVFGQNDSEQPDNTEEMADRKTEMMAEKLMLSEDQQEEVYQANLEMLEAKRNGDKSMGDIKKEYDEEMREILNDEQYRTYRQHDEKGAIKRYKDKDMHKHDAPRQKGHRESQNPEMEAKEMTQKMANNLDLSEDQFERLYEANLELAKARQQHGEEMRELHQRHDQHMEEILDEEQFMRYKQQKAERHERMKERRTNKSERMQRMEQKREMHTPANQDRK